MTRTTLVRVLLAIVVAAALGSAWFIVASNNGPGTETPSGFLH